MEQLFHGSMTAKYVIGLIRYTIYYSLSIPWFNLVRV